MKGIRFGLIAKYGLAVSLILVSISIVQSVFLFQLERSRAELMLKNHGLSLARNLADSSEYGILANNIAILERLVKGVSENKEIVYAQILDKKGSILAQAKKKVNGNVPIFNIEYPVKSIAAENPPEEIGLLPLAPATGNIHEEIIGRVKLGVSHVEIIRETGRLLIIVSILTLVLIAAGFLGVYMLSRYLLAGPLRQFVLGTQKIAHGYPAFKIELESPDEIGDLASSFNTMTSELKKSKDEIEVYTKNLELLVKERTKELEHAKTGLEAEVAKRTAELEKERAGLEEKVNERTKELQKNILDLQVFHDAAVGRELKMIDLEKEVNVLLVELGREPKYK